MLSPGNARWAARRGGQSLDLGGARVLHSWPATGWRAKQDDAAVRLALPTGTTVQLHLFAGDVETLAAALEGSAVAPAAGAESDRLAPPQWSAWAILLVLVGLGWIAPFVAMAISATPATATVTGGDGDGSCDVEWLGADQRVRRGEIDCWEDQEGSTRTVWVLSDEPGDVTDPAWFTGGMLAIGVVVAAPGAVRLLVVRRRRQVWARREMRLLDARSSARGFDGSWSQK